MRMKSFLAVAAVAMTTALSGCISGAPYSIFSSDYGSKKDAGYQLPSVPIYKVDRKYHRQIVRYDTAEKPGTIVVDTGEKFLYLVMPDGKAMRYG
ncbi:L,D-transpeptidase, partial [Rhizobiaceae sp. 2RAB30]